MADKYLKITLVRSPIGYRKNQRVTAESLGLRKLQSTVVHKATPQIRGMVFQLQHLLKVEELDDYEPKPKAAKPGKAGRKPLAELPAPAVVAKPTAKAVPAPAEPVAETPVAESKPKPDNLTKIEGIGPKMSAALQAAGIDTFAKLAGSDVDTLKQAIEAAGMSLAPSVDTWAEQAGFAANEDWDGLKALQDELVGGRRVN